MKTIKKRKIVSKRIFILSAAIVVILLLGAGVYAYMNNLLWWKADETTSTLEVNNVDYGSATDEQIKNSASIKADGGSSDKPTSPTTVDGSTKKSVQVTITSANQNESILQIRTLIGAVENTGVCTLTLTSDGQPTVVKTANVQALASTSTCQGFDVPISELSTGSWNILIEYTNDTLTGSATRDKVIG